ncbi:MAG: LysR family transcriptional regulator [Nocardioidaceae bacterium]|nr:LysR family transcriptional regulator [Nocardioidaceae bacterium]
MRLSAFHLQVLGEVQRAGSMAGAARALGVSPPAISQQVARVESQLGVAVVSRGSRGATLTDLGAALAAHGRSITDQVEAAEETAGRLLGVHARRLRVGALATTVAPILADALATIRLRFPDSELSVVEVGSDTGVELVADGALDLALVAGYGVPLTNEGVTIREVAVDELLLVVPDDHAIPPDTAPVDLRSLADEAWVSGAPGRRHREQLDEIAADFGFVPRVAFETESFEVALALVSAGVAIAVVPATSRRDLAGIRHHRIEGSPARLLYAVTAHDVSHLPLAEPMLAAIRQTARESSSA